jgi:hypothetical protein
MILRKCKECGVEAHTEVELEGFVKTPNKMKHGRLNKCKPCGSKASVEWAESNKEKVNTYNKRWAQNNRDKTRAKSLKWSANNRSSCNARGAKRRAQQLNATPVWADLEAIKSWYSLAKMFDKTFKEKHHVDHIVPLQGKNICGLHVEYNLQVLTAVENIKKSNKEVYHFL